MHKQSAIKRLLIISYFSGMDSSAASHHIDDRLPELEKQGVDFEIISSVCGVKNPNYKHYRIFSGLFSGLRYEIRHLLRQKISHYGVRKTIETLLLLPIILFYALEKVFVRLDATWSWFLTCTPFGIYRVIRFKPEAIYVTGGAVSGHMAGLLISRVTGVPFISEFQDPIVYQLNPKKKMEKRYNLWLEKKVAQHSTKLIFLTKNATEAAKQRNQHYVDNIAEKIVTIYPGLTALLKLANKQNLNTSDKKIISHFGTLAGSRNLDVLIEAMKTLNINSGVEIHLYGHLDSDVKNAIQQSGRTDLFKIFGKVSRDTALARMADADILLLIQNKDSVSTQTIPSKVYEYMQTGKLILSYAYKNEELSEILIAHGHLSSDLQDKAECTALLSRVIESDIEILNQDVKDYTYGLQQCVNLLIKVLSDTREPEHNK